MPYRKARPGRSGWPGDWLGAGGEAGVLGSCLARGGAADGHGWPLPETRGGWRALPVALPPATPTTEINWPEPYPDVLPEARCLARESAELAFAAASVCDPAGGADPARGARLLRGRGGRAARHIHRLGQQRTERARKAVGSAAPTQQTALRDFGDAAVDDIAARWADACGKDEVRAFLISGPLRSHWRLLPTTADGQVAFGAYLWDEGAGAYVSGSLDVLTLLDGCVAEIVGSLTRFGLPARIRP